jgi:hypothetical protein
MTTEKLILAPLLMLLASTAEGGLLPRISGTGDQSRIIATAASQDGQNQNDNVQGTWSGTFRSRHPFPAPFTLTVAIGPGTDGRMHGRIVNQSGITSCLARGDVDLQVIVNGSDVVLAGSDQVGNTLTFHGTIDNTGKVLTFNYVTNGSASGKCESDDGTANLQKQ